MKTVRPWLLLAAVLIAAALAHLARQVVHDVILLPLAYLLWQLQGVLAGVPQLVQYVTLVFVMALIMIWQLVPRLKQRIVRAAPVRIREGQVELTAVSLLRARSSNYFRWQLANRLGRAAGQLGGIPAAGPHAAILPASIADYLDAGLNHSFVDFAAPRFLFRGRSTSQLDLDPDEVVQYLESYLIQSGGIHVEDR